MLLALGGLLVWAPLHAHGQTFTINPIADRSVAVLTTVAIQVTITDSNIPPSQLNFSLASNRPNTDAANASINPNYGGFLWTPTQAQIVTFTVTATSLPSGYQTSTSFSVIVTNGAPVTGGVVIDTIPPQTVAEGTLLTFTSTAHATDNPNSPLLFQPRESARRGEHRQQQHDERSLHLDAHRGPGGESLLHDPRGGYRGEHLSQQLPGFPGDRHPDQRLLAVPKSSLPRWRKADISVSQIARRLY